MSIAMLSLSVKHLAWCFTWRVHSFKRYFLSICCVPGIVPEAEVTGVPTADKSIHSGTGR